MVNKWIGIGQVGKDPEFRVTAGGTAMARFSLATTESRKDKDGNRTKETSWHRCVVWQKQAEIARDYLKKGTLLYVEGRIQYGNYEKDGLKVYTTDIVVNNFQMLSGKADGESRPKQEYKDSPGFARDAPARREEPKSEGGFEDDDLPF